MRRILLLGLAFIVGGFFVVRAMMEPFVIDFSDPSTYENDWGGPSLIGVLLVHMGPGLIAVALFLRWMVRSDRRQRADPPAER
ncbi:hypothetical protein [Glycomyces tarimensis]